MKNKAKKPPDLDKDESPFARYLPDNPILAGAWLSCLQWSLKQPGALEAFQRQPATMLRQHRRRLTG